MKFKVVVREIRIKSDNPFKPISIMGTTTVRTMEIEADSEAAVRQFFDDAVRQNLPSVKGFELESVTELQ